MVFLCKSLGLGKLSQVLILKSKEDAQLRRISYELAPKRSHHPGSGRYAKGEYEPQAR
jgi:hypothetical protein